MWVKALRLKDFRSYESVEISLDTGVTTFVGANGQGKTNLVEAVLYTSLLSSHRVSSDSPLVRVGAHQAYVGVDVVSDDRTTSIEIEINPGKSNRARINKAAATRARDVLGIVRTVCFAPEDLALVKGDPADRRRFLDDLLTQRIPRMLAVKADYDRVLKQRNALLKSSGAARRSSRSDVERTLEVWDHQLAEFGSQLLAARVALTSDLEPFADQTYDVLAGGERAVSSRGLVLEYQSSAGVSKSTDREFWRLAILEAMERRRTEELDRGVTLVGPHRDDLVITLGEFPAKGFASHGEAWSAALALRLASLDLLKVDGDDPILILDDVFAELDAARREHLTERAALCSQVMITAAVAADVPGGLQGRRLMVSKGMVHEDEAS